MAYEPHSNYLTPPDDFIVRRFIDLAKFLDLLENRQLYFCRADLLEDHREGRLTDFERAQIRDAHEDTESLIRRFESFREEFYVNCWYAGEDESIAMWKFFGDSGYSLAIGSTIGTIKKTLAQVAGPVYVGKVDYLDWSRQSSPAAHNVIGMMVRKSRAYLHENEVRLVICPLWQLPSGDAGGGLDTVPPSPAINVERVANQMAAALRAVSPTLEVPPDQLRWICIDAILKSAHNESLERKPLGVTIPVDPNELVTELIVGPDVPDWVYKLLCSVSLRYGLSARIRWSNLKSVEEPS